MPSRHPKSQHHLLAILAATLVAIGCNGTEISQGTSDPDTPEPGLKTAVDPDQSPPPSVSLEIKSWKETEALIAAQTGKVVVVDLWSTSCVPCMREFPQLVALHNKYPSDKITCISVSCDYEGLESEPPESKKLSVLKFLKSTKATCTNLLLSDADLDVYEAIGLAAIPAVYVYDTKGKLAKRFDNDSGEYGDEGFTYEDHIVPLIETLLEADNLETRPEPSR
jgi:thiol-disulfide isomerase/thioredoxin